MPSVSFRVTTRLLQKLSFARWTFSAAFFFAAVSVFAAGEKPPIEFGLSDLTGREFALNQNDRQRVRAFVFLGTECPVSNAMIPELNDVAQLQTGDARAETYLIVISELKSNFAGNFTFRQHSDSSRQGVLDGLKGGKVVGDPKDLVINGRPAVQYAIEGVAENIPVLYLHTTIDGKDSFHQVLAWTLSSRAGTHRGVLEDVTNSFTENR